MGNPLSTICSRDKAPKTPAMDGQDAPKPMWESVSSSVRILFSSDDPKAGQTQQQIDAVVTGDLGFVNPSPQKRQVLFADGGRDSTDEKLMVDTVSPKSSIVVPPKAQPELEDDEDEVEVDGKDEADADDGKERADEENPDGEQEPKSLKKTKSWFQRKQKPKIAKGVHITEHPLIDQMPLVTNIREEALYEEPSPALILNITALLSGELKMKREKVHEFSVTAHRDKWPTNLQRLDPMGSTKQAQDTRESHVETVMESARGRKAGCVQEKVERHGFVRKVFYDVLIYRKKDQTKQMPAGEFIFLLKREGKNDNYQILCAGGEEIPEDEEDEFGSAEWSDAPKSKRGSQTTLEPRSSRTTAVDSIDSTNSKS